MQDMEVQKLRKQKEEYLTEIISTILDECVSKVERNLVIRKMSKTLFWLARSRTCEAQTEACMALPGPAKGLAVATVTYINYPSRRKP